MKQHPNMEIEKIENFLKGSEKITFNGKGQADTYKWIQTALIKFQYINRCKSISPPLIPNKGISGALNFIFNF